MHNTYTGCGANVTTSYFYTTGWSIQGKLGLHSKDSSSDNFEGPLGLDIVNGSTDTWRWGADCSGVHDNPDAVCLLHFQAVTTIIVDFFQRAACGIPGRKLKPGVVILPSARNEGSTHIRGFSYSGDKNMMQCEPERGGILSFFYGTPGGLGFWEKPRVMAGSELESINTMAIAIEPRSR